MKHSPKPPPEATSSQDGQDGKDDSVSFRELIGPCRELVDDHAPPWRSRTPARRRPQSSTGDEHVCGGPEQPPHDPAAAMRSPRGELRRLARGRLPISARLDLHGLDRKQAGSALARFIARQRGPERRCVLVIHGKGMRSAEQRPVLKGFVHDWLARAEDVGAFCPAQPRHGGEGAVYVLLRARPV